MRDQKTYKIIGAGLEACRHKPAIGFAFRRGGRVHKELGCGFLEAVYYEALEREFVTQKNANVIGDVVTLSS